jgi:hypothetical protein
MDGIQAFPCTVVVVPVVMVISEHQRRIAHFFDEHRLAPRHVY